MLEKNKNNVIIIIGIKFIIWDWKSGDNMYDLGDNFKFDFNISTANKECVFKGEK